MFSFTKKIGIALSLLAVSSGQFVAFGTNNNNNNEEWYEGGELVKRNKSTTKSDSLQNKDEGLIEVNSKTLDPCSKPEFYKIDNLILTRIILFTSKLTNPTKFRLLSKQWKSFLDGLEKPQLLINLDKISLAQQCMTAWLSNDGRNTILGRFFNGRLVYKKGAPEELVLPFSVLGNPFKGTFDSSVWGNIADDVVITINDFDRFSEVKGKNENKLVIGLFLRQMAEQEIGSSAKPLAALMNSWKVSVAILWRYGNWVDMTWFDYLTNESLDSVSSYNVFEHWKKSTPALLVWRSMRREATLSLSRFHVCFEPE